MEIPTSGNGPSCDSEAIGLKALKGTPALHPLIVTIFMLIFINKNVFAPPTVITTCNLVKMVEKIYVTCNDVDKTRIYIVFL
ncbi:hypothetical protein V8F06_004923 [Rhypophila decipiens]